MIERDQLTSYIRDIPDFPKPGIIFKDITPLLASHEAFASVVELLADPFREEGITRVAAIESRGFIFGGALARSLGCGFAPVRKPGKLPWRTFRRDYELEYGTDALEIHVDAIGRDDRVLIVDDVLATGGTGAATAELLQQFGARIVALAVVVELEFLKGRGKLGDTPVFSLIKYA